MTAVLERTAPSTENSPPLRHRWNLGFASVLGLGALSGFAFLGRPSFYLDEAVSVSLADASWRRFASVVTHREANMVLYSLLLRGWIQLGTGEATVRSLSVLAFVGAIAATVVLGRELFDRRVALVAGLLLAVNPVTVEFAQEARGYALSVALVTLSSLLFVRAIGGGGPLLWGTVAMTAVLAAYTNLWAVLVPLAQAVSLAFRPAGTVPWRRAVPAAVGVAVLLVPMGLLVHSTDSAGTNWAAGTAAGALFAKVRAHVPHVLIDVLVFAVLAVLGWAVAVLRRRVGAQQLARWWPVVYCVCWLVVPVTAVVLVSVSYKPLLVLRYLGVCVPPAIILAAAAVCRLRFRLAAVALAVLLVASAAGVARWYRHGPGQDWRDAAAYVAARASSGDGVLLFAPYVRIPFQWYLARHPAAESRLQPVYPGAGWTTSPLVFDTTYFPFSRSVVARAAARYQRVWVVLSQASLYPSQEEALLAGLRQAGLGPTTQRDFPGVEVLRYSIGGR